MKKSLHALLVSLLCFFLLLTGCRPQNEETQEAALFPVATGQESVIEPAEEFGVTLTVDPREYSGQNITVAYSLENTTDTTYVYEEGTISIEVLQADAWHKLTVRTDQDFLLANIAYLVHPYDIHDGTAGFWRYGDTVPAGTYRLVIGLRESDEQQTGNTVYHQYDLTAEFTVTD